MTLRLLQVRLGGFDRRWLHVVLGSSVWAYAGLVSRHRQVLDECGRA